MDASKASSPREESTQPIVSSESAKPLTFIQHTGVKKSSTVLRINSAPSTKISLRDGISQPKRRLAASPSQHVVETGKPKPAETPRVTGTPPLRTSSRSSRSTPKTEKPTSQALSFITVTDPKDWNARSNRSLIHVHAMKEVAKRERAEARQRLQNFQPYKSSGRTAPAREISLWCHCSDLGSSEALTSRSESVTDWSSLPCGICGRRIRAFKMEEVLQKNEALPLLLLNTSPKSILGAGRVDPFRSYPVNATPGRVDMLIDFYATRAATSPIMAAKDIKSHSIISTLLSWGFGDPAFFNIFLSSIAFAINPDQVTTEALRYKGEAIRILNEDLRNLKKPIDDSCFGTIICLANFECRAGDRESCEAHMNGLARVFNIRAHSNNPLDKVTTRGLFWADINSAAISGNKRFFSHEMFPELHWERNTFHGYNPLPPGYFTHLDILNEPLVEVIRDLSALQGVVDWKTKSTADMLEWNNGQASVESRLCHMQTWNLSGKAECCRLALYLCSNAFLNTSWDSDFVMKHFAAKIGYALLETDLVSCWDEHVDLLLWIAYVGGAYSKDTPLHSAYLQLIREISNQLGSLAENWEQIEDILQTFIWSAEILEQRCKALWVEAQADP